MRIGAVNFLNSKPLVYGLERLAPHVRLSFDLPCRLADSLAANRYDVALIPCVEYFRNPGYSIVSDACVSCRGPVRSVKLYFRVPPREVRRLALDESSRTSAALAQILLAELCDVSPRNESLPIGRGFADSDADAVLVIGDRAIQSPEPSLRQTCESLAASDEASDDDIIEVWDLGESWCKWTGLPFVFAMWIARPGVDTGEAAALLAAARDEGVRHLAEIAAVEALPLGISCELALDYLQSNLHFTLGHRERAGLTRYYQLCVERGLALPDLEHTIEICNANGCSSH